MTSAPQRISLMVDMATDDISLQDMSNASAPLSPDRGRPLSIVDQRRRSRSGSRSNSPAPFGAVRVHGHKVVGFTADDDEEGENEDFSKRKTLRPVGTTAARRGKGRRESVSNVFRQSQGEDDVGNRGYNGQVGRISNQLNSNGKMGDATCQTDPFSVLETLPSEKRVERLIGHEVRNELESVMPYQKGNKSIVMERKEIQRLTLKPTLKEFKSMTRTESLRTFKVQVGRKAREAARQERQKLGLFKRLLFDLKALNARFRNHRRYEWIPLWRGEIKYVEGVFGGVYSAFFSFARWAWLLNLAMSILIFCLIILVGLLVEGWSTMKIDFLPFVPAFMGNKDSFFFIGGYPIQTLNGVYQMQFAYLLVIFACLFISCITIMESLKRIYLRRSETSTNIMLNDYSPFTTVIFTCWDFSLNNKNGVKHYQHAVSTALRTLLTKSQVESKRLSSLQGREFVSLLLIRIFVNALVLALLCVEAFLIYYFIRNESLNSIVIGDTGYDVKITPFLVSAFNIVLPILFTILSKFERHPTQLQAITYNIARSYLVRLASIYVLLFSYVDSDTNSLFNQEATCWESKLGMEFYQLIWINVVVNILFGFGTGFLQTSIMRLIKKNRSRYYEFDIGANVLDIIYEQSLIWIGMLFCPAIPVLSLFLQVCTFYAKYFGLKYYAMHPTELYSASLMYKAFLAFLFLTLVLSAVPVGYAVTSMKPACGPYKDYEAMYLMIPAIVEQAPQSFASFLLFLATPGFVVPLLVTLFVIIYYLVATNKKRKLRVAELELELFSEREDKRYLLKFYNIKL